NQDRNQNGLISCFDFNRNDEFIIDGVVLFNNTSNGNATQHTWTSYASVIAKVSSTGNTQSDVSVQTGKE
ncbi:transferrin-binding protein-like solute binding protein, partial [Neisseria sp. P0017.S007]